MLRNAMPWIERIQSHKHEEICNEPRRRNKLIIRNFHDLLLIRRQPVCVP